MSFKTTLITAVMIISYNMASASTPIIESRVVTADEIEWGYLNPLRGDQSPGAADLWGDRTQTGGTGMLVRFGEGFASPPHIHNVTYRGVVIKGMLHNDDPKAAHMWLPTGSFWIQPAGEAHITAANGSENLAYIEIDSGPYLVSPTTEAFDNGEKPINVDASNLMWVSAADLKWSDYEYAEAGINTTPQVAFLWGQRGANQLNGTLLKLPAGFDGTIINPKGEFKAVVIQGELTYQQKHQNLKDTVSNDLSTEIVKQLQPGSYFESKKRYMHKVSTQGLNEETIIYIRSAGVYELSN